MRLSHERPVDMRKKSVLYSTLLLSASGLVLQLLGFLYRIVISRMAGAQGMALYQLIFPVYGLVSSICIGGLCSAAVTVSAEQHAAGHASLKALLPVAFKIFFTLFLCAALPVLLGAEWIASAVLGDSRTYPLILILLPTLLLTGIENLCKSFFHGIHDVRPVAVSEITELCLRLASAFLLIYIVGSRDAGVNSALIVTGMLISEVCSSALMYLFYRRKAKTLALAGTVSRTDIRRRIVRLALPVATAGLLSSISHSASMVMIPRLLTVWGMPQGEALTAFGVLMGMVAPFLGLPMVFIGALSAVIFPRISKARALGQSDDLRRKVALSLHGTGLFSLPVTAVIVTIGPYLCHFMFGQMPDKLFFSLLAALSVFGYYEAILGNIMGGLGLEKRFALFTILQGALQLVVLCAAMPFWGLYGYAAAVLAGSLFRFSLSFVSVVHTTGVRVHMTRWFLSPLVTAALCGLLSRLAFYVMLSKGISELPAILYMTSGCLILYTVLMNVQGIRPLRQVRELFQKQ